MAKAKSLFGPAAALALCISLTACSAHARRIRCDGALRPINTPAPVAASDPKARPSSSGAPLPKANPAAPDASGALGGAREP